MPTIREVQHGTDAFDDAVHSMVRCERINDVLAKVGTKRYDDYLQHVQSQVLGETDPDPKDQYREQAKELLPRALEAYALRNEVQVVTGRIYFHDTFPICAAPDAVDGLIGLTVHIRQTLDTYRSAVEKGIDNEMLRYSQAVMLVTGLPYFLHLNYFEQANPPIRKLYEHDVVFDKHRAAQLEQALIQFAAKSRFKAAEVAA